MYGFFFAWHSELCSQTVIFGSSPCGDVHNKLMSVLGPKDYITAFTTIKCSFVCEGD